MENWNLVHKRDSEEEHNRTNWCLVEKELGRRHGQFLMVSTDKNRISGRRTNAGQSKNDSDSRGRSDLFCGTRGSFGLRVIVGGDAYADADRNENKSSITWDGGAVEDVIDNCCHGREEHAAELIDGDCGEGEGEIGEMCLDTIDLLEANPLVYTQMSSSVRWLKKFSIPKRL